VEKVGCKGETGRDNGDVTAMAAVGARAVLMRGACPYRAGGASVAAVLVHPIADGWRWSGLGRAAVGSALCSRKEQRKARGKRNSALAAVVRAVVAVGCARWAGSAWSAEGREVEG